MSAPLIFLDVDGVLHPLTMNVDKGGQLSTEHLFTPACMQRLVRLVRATGAEVVISSSWRMFEGTIVTLADALKSYGLTFNRCTTTAALDGTRASQILAFLEANALQDRPYVILDDEDVTCGKDSLMMQVIRSKFVQTDPEVGLTDSDTDRAISILTDASDGEG